MLLNQYMFNNDTLNIFTDASITQLKTGEFVSCPGASACTGSDSYTHIIEEPRYIIRNSTNNNGEISAIDLGIDLAYKYRGYFSTVNIISDSQICISGLREWIFNWVNNIDPVTGLMFSSSGKPVANQEVFIRIAKKIVFSGLKINLLHQRGHIDYRKPADLAKCKKDFQRSNWINQEVDMELIKNLAIANDRVDLFTKDELDKFLITYYQNNAYLEGIQRMVNYENSLLDIKSYKDLINAKNKKHQY